MTYRDYLKDWLDRAKGSGLSRRSFAKSVFMSHSHLSNIESGRRPLDDSRIDVFAEAMDLTGRERDYWRALVQLESHDASVRNAAQLQVNAHQSFLAASRDHDALCDLYVWYIGAVYQLSRCEGWQDDPVWVAQAVKPSISVEQAADALDRLERRGLLKRDASGQRLYVHRNFASDVAVSAALDDAVRSQQVDLAAHAGAAMTAFGGDQRLSQSLVLAVDEDQHAAIRDIVVSAQKNIIAVASREGTSDRVVAIVQYVFPVATP